MDDRTVTCSWFARCIRPAAGCVSHPILGWVPTCRECADGLGLDLVEGEVVIVASTDN